MDTLVLAIKIVFWVITSIFVGYFKVIRWWLVKKHGIATPFPVLSFGLSLALTLFLIYMSISA